MSLVQVEPDIYEFLEKNVRHFRETESAVLRRLLNLPTPKAPSGVPPATPKPAGSALAHFVAELRSKASSSATDKFLAILSFAHRQDPGEFKKVLAVGGRKRKYFAQSRQEILSSGKSTHPRQIPGSDYWVMTNADTRQKCEMMREALELLGYGEDDIRAADAAVF